jgi:hypothetical protein
MVIWCDREKSALMPFQVLARQGAFFTGHSIFSSTPDKKHYPALF